MSKIYGMLSTRRLQGWDVPDTRKWAHRRVLWQSRNMPNSRANRHLRSTGPAWQVKPHLPRQAISASGEIFFSFCGAFCRHPIMSSTNNSLSMHLIGSDLHVSLTYHGCNFCNFLLFVTGSDEGVGGASGAQLSILPERRESAFSHRSKRRRPAR